MENVDHAVLRGRPTPKPSRDRPISQCLFAFDKLAYRAEGEVTVELAATVDDAKVFARKNLHTGWGWHASNGGVRCKSWPLQQLTDIIRVSFEW